MLISFVTLLINLLLALTVPQVSTPKVETPAPTPKVHTVAPVEKAPVEKKAPIPVQEADPEVLTGNQCEYEDGSGDQLPCYWDAKNNGNHEGHSFWILSDGSTFYDEEGIYDGYVTPEEKVICPEGWDRSWDDGDGYLWSACM